MKFAVATFTLLCSGLMAQATPDLAAIKAEVQLERRYWLALEFGSDRITAARKAYQDGKLDEYAEALKAVRDAAQICDDALRSTGKRPSKNPKHFKRAELKMREMLRRLDQLGHEVSFDDREPAEKAKRDVQHIHENLLLDIMGRRK